MEKTAKKTDNQIVAEWLIQHRWRDSLTSGTKQRMPAFVDNAVMAAIYVVAGTSNGQVNVSPKLVFKCLMLPSISVETVSKMEVGYAISKRHAQRLAQTVRFALEGILHRVQEYENQISDTDKENTEMEREFIKDYYLGRDSKLYSQEMQPLPTEILQLKVDGKYIEYAEAVREFRINVAV